MSVWDSNNNVYSAVIMLQYCESSVSSFDEYSSNHGCQSALLTKFVTICVQTVAAKEQDGTVRKR